MEKERRDRGEKEKGRRKGGKKKEGNMEKLGGRKGEKEAGQEMSVGVSDNIDVFVPQLLSPQSSHRCLKQKRWRR